jgi:hypothetical protein
MPTTSAQCKSSTRFHVSESTGRRKLERTSKRAVCGPEFAGTPATIAQLHQELSPTFRVRDEAWYCIECLFIKRRGLFECKLTDGILGCGTCTAGGFVTR